MEFVEAIERMSRSDQPVWQDHELFEHLSKSLAAKMLLDACSEHPEAKALLKQAAKLAGFEKADWEEAARSSGHA